MRLLIESTKYLKMFALPGKFILSICIRAQQTNWFVYMPLSSYTYSEKLIYAALRPTSNAY